MTEKYKNISSSYVLDSKDSGPLVSIFSGIHGNESSGIHANTLFLERVQQGEIEILKGQVIGILEGNEQAVKLKQREVEKNLNRLFSDENTSQDCYEDARAQELKSILRNSDYLLDLHSTSGPSIPFAFVEKEHLDFAKKLGISHLIAGWGDLKGGVTSGDTEVYMNQQGGVGVTFEAGNHDDPNAKNVAYQVILNYLSTLGVIDKRFFKTLSSEENFMEIVDVYVAKTDNFTYKLEANNFESVHKGELIGIDGEEHIYAQHDMTLVMPKKASITKKGNEVFFIGKKT